MQWLRDANDLVHQLSDTWPVHPDVDVLALMDVVPEFSQRTPNKFEAVYARDGGYIQVRAAHGEFYMRAVHSDLAALEAMGAWVREQVPVHAPTEPDVIPVTFWSHGAHGPMSVRRELDADGWDTIGENYPAETRELVSLMMAPEFQPGKGGQLILWHGVPGTGKTTALRTLAREWRDWCEMHYIVDPEQFFGAHADYMIQVLMASTRDIAFEFDGPDGIVSEKKRAKWRVLILEDCGELLAPDARRDVGQALSRLLNACDGMIGRGLRVMLLVTTNEPLEKLHEAVARPGRCAAKVEFRRFLPAETRAWLEDHGVDANDPSQYAKLPSSPTLADLYGLIEDFQTRSSESTFGFVA